MLTEDAVSGSLVDGFSFLIVLHWLLGEEVVQHCTFKHLQVIKEVLNGIEAPIQDRLESDAWHTANHVEAVTDHFVISLSYGVLVQARYVVKRNGCSLEVKVNNERNLDFILDLFELHLLALLWQLEPFTC